MALIKDIELKNGIITNYHRIVSIQAITNNDIVIEVARYISKNKRIEEMEYNNGDREKSNVYIDTIYYSKEYQEEFNIKDAYDYLKTLDEYKGAIDD